jgi:hypothetical protein
VSWSRADGALRAPRRWPACAEAAGERPMPSRRTSVRGAQLRRAAAGRRRSHSRRAGGAGEPGRRR